MSAGAQSVLTEASRGFPYSVLANVRILPSLRPRSFLTRFFPIRRSPIIPPLHAVQSVMLRVCLWLHPQLCFSLVCTLWAR